ncbi:hypothetical protein A1O7_04452 [Cladophialophora yegresii CBS 114405]|uniref:FHA domain-containing protein n=1 Tax=Cladophialophora yegresii CBS 114405 TaxID=1182544 RepID=W9W5L1_9EURO|nr:uncharacterized protein A1O7_04452 [Cladophialophora yegresii CBS 114405]EXJ60300.1 hypothetical protein A1O7_04452 [Cladophialophora yegresii CBS 114405]
MAGTEHPDLHVTVTLEDVDLREPIPKRTVTLRGPAWHVNIGRGTQSGYGGITAAPDNTWFDSKVMSRNHAILRADPATKDILIEDIGSMHGTQLCGRRLSTYQVEKVWCGDNVTLGADVVRGSAHFSALRLRVAWKWSDESSDSNNLHSSHSNIYRNTFTADYYSEDEAYEEPSSEILGDQEEPDYQVYEEVDGHLSESANEDQVIQDSVREASIEVVVPQAPPLTTPDSDEVSTQDSSSLEEFSDDETESAMRSKIVTLSPVYTLTPVTSATHLDKNAPSPPSATSPADVIHFGKSYDNGDTSEPESCADDELENEYSDPLETDYVPSSQTEAAPSSSIMNAPIPQEHGRAPSPSDAAMVKPSGESANFAWSTAPPWPKYPQYGLPFCGFVHPSGRPGPDLTDNNSALCDPVPRPSTQQRSQFDSVYQPSHTTCPPVYAAPFGFQGPAGPAPAHPLSPLSIASLVQQQPEEESRGSKKRKADQISSDTLHANPAPSEFASSEIGNVHAALMSNDADVMRPAATTIELNQPPLATEVAEAAPATNSEPLRKRARRSKSRTGERRGHGIIKMAAATITGMAIGAVGTVIGLAALPQDYFI